MKNIVKFIWVLSMFCLGMFFHTHDLVSVENIKYKAISTSELINKDVQCVSDLLKVSKGYPETTKAIKPALVKCKEIKTIKPSNKELAATRTSENTFNRTSESGTITSLDEPGSSGILHIDYTKNPIEVVFTF